MPPGSGSGNAESGTSNTGTNGDAGRSPSERDGAVVAEMREYIRSLTENHTKGDKEREILDKNFKLRRKLAIVNDELAALRAKAPGVQADGTLVLSKEDAAEYQAFKSLNVKAADLKTIVTEHGDFKTKLAERDAEELYVDVADAMGFENLPAFMRFMEREKLHVELKDVQERDEETGKMVTVQVPMVRPKADEKAQLEPLADYVEREVPEFIDIFQMAPDEEGADEMAGIGAAGGPGVAGDDASGTESFTRRAARLSQGDREARRSAGLTGNAGLSGRRPAATAGTAGATSGVRMPVTRNARPSTGTSRQAKEERELYDQKRAAYGSL